LQVPVKLFFALSISPMLLYSRTSIVFCCSSVVDRQFTSVISERMHVFCLTISGDMELIALLTLTPPSK